MRSGAVAAALLSAALLTGCGGQKSFTPIPTTDTTVTVTGTSPSAGTGGEETVTTGPSSPITTTVVAPSTTTVTTGGGSSSGGSGLTQASAGGLPVSVPTGWVEKKPGSTGGDFTAYLWQDPDDSSQQLLVIADGCTGCAEGVSPSQLAPSDAEHVSNYNSQVATFNVPGIAASESLGIFPTTGDLPADYSSDGVIVLHPQAGLPYVDAIVTLPTSEHTTATAVLNSIAAPGSTSAPASTGSCPSSSSLLALWKGETNAQRGVNVAAPNSVFSFGTPQCWQNWVATNVIGNGNGTFVFSTTGGLHSASDTENGQLEREVCADPNAAPTFFRDYGTEACDQES